MMITKSILRAAALALAFCASSAFAVLGYEMGQKLEGEPDGTHLFYGLDYQSKVDAYGFDGVAAYYTDATGVCTVIAFSSVEEGLGNGNEHRLVADSLKERLTAKYGEATRKDDFLMPGSVWDEPRDWVTAIRAGERHYGYIWKVVGKDVASIRVAVEADAVTLQYLFSNFGQCQKEADKEL